MTHPVLRRRSLGRFTGGLMSTHRSVHALLYADPLPVATGIINGGVRLGESFKEAVKGTREPVS